MSSKHSRDEDGQGETQAVGGERTKGSHRSAPRADEPEAGFEKREDYKQGPKRSVFFVLRRTVREFLDDGGTDLAAALTYYAVLAIFPGLIALLALVGLFGQADESIDLIVEILAPLVATDTIYNQIKPTLTELASLEGAGVTLVIGLLGALWAASGYIGAFSRAMNRIYEVEEGRPFWRLRPMQILITVTNVVLCAVALFILIISGPVAEAVGSAIGVGDDLVVIWNYAKWPVLALVVMAIVALLYYATPNVDFTRFRVISTGSFVAILVWLVASVGFAFYVANFNTYNKTYGSVAGVVIALLWLWITNLALLFGAELDAELERGRELQLGIASEETLQLPVRDTRGIQKTAARQAEDLARMREIRLASTTPGDPADRPFVRT
jgi:membrane protein